MLLLALTLTVLRLFPKPALADLIPQSTAIYAADDTLLRLTLASDSQYQLWAPLEYIQPKAVEAVKLYEDRYFAWHWGVNPVALLRGMWRTLFGGSRQGASTITMQLAREIYNIDSRNTNGKFQQIVAAIWLESRYSKPDILEAYLNIAPYGGNIKGIATASLVYFNKSPSQLNLPEAITLAVIPQNPNKRLSLSSQNSPLNLARVRLWQSWLNKNPQDKQYNADMALPDKALNKTLHLPSLHLPFVAPHFTDAILSELGQDVPQHTIRTGLNRQAQATLERMLKSYVENNKNMGITNEIGRASCRERVCLAV